MSDPEDIYEYYKTQKMINKNRRAREANERASSGESSPIPDAYSDHDCSLTRGGIICRVCDHRMIDTVGSKALFDAMAIKEIDDIVHSLLGPDEKAAVATISTNNDAALLPSAGRECYVIYRGQVPQHAFESKMTAYGFAQCLFDQEYLPNFTTRQLVDRNYLAKPRDISDCETVQVVRFIEAQ